MNQKFAQTSISLIARHLSIRSRIRTSNNMAFDLEDKLFSLSANGKVSELKSLISMSNIKLNASNQRGWTALMFAARNGHKDVVSLLVEKGANVEQQNGLGQTAYDIAAFWSQTAILSLLKQADTESQPTEPVHYFTVRNLDRANEKRKDLQWLKERLATSQLTTFILAFVKTFPVLTGDEKNYSVRKFLPKDLENFVDMENCEQSEIVFLGMRTNDETGKQECLFAVDISQETYTDIQAAFPNENLYVPKGLRDAFLLDSEEAALTGLAHSVLDWHRNCIFCQCCGYRTKFAHAGYKRECTNEDCRTVREVKNSSYLRLDPTIIVAVISTDKSKLLLAQGRRFIPNMWSCLAGFMEPGESIEDACRREVFEETGIRVGRVTYHSTQPWPFPTQIMIGLIGHATNTDITVDKSELSDAKWFSRSEVVQMMTRNHPHGYFNPPHNAIAHHLIKAFLHNTSSKI